MGKEIVDLCLNRVRNFGDNYTSLQGFLTFIVVRGGTDFGLGSLLVNSLFVNSGKKSKLGFTMYLSQVSIVVAEPYNSVLSTHVLLELTDVAVLMDNDAIYGICKRSLDNERPTYTYLNRLISHVVSSLTTSLRFDGAINVDIAKYKKPELKASLVVIKKIMKFDSSGPFNRHVDSDALGILDYFDVMNTRMDFAAMGNIIENDF